jgi:hypothetical protein
MFGTEVRRVASVSIAFGVNLTHRLRLAALLEPQRHALGGFLDARALGAEVQADLLLLERPLERRDGVGVLGGDQVVEELDDRHLGAEVREDGRELAPDHAAADDHEARRHVVDRQEPGRVEAARVVDALDRRPQRLRAGRDHGVLEGDGLAALDRHLVGAREPPTSLDDRDAVGLQQPAETGHRAVDHLLLVGLHLGPVDLDAGDLHAQLGERGVRVLDGVSALHQRLRRDAADVQAGAAEAPLLDHGHGQAELAGADRGRVTARSAAENGDVDVHEKGFSLGDVAPGETGFGESTPGRVSGPRPAEYNRTHADAG